MSSGFLFIQSYGQKYLVVWFLFIQLSSFGLIMLEKNVSETITLHFVWNGYLINSDKKEKEVLNQKYRVLRNKVTSQIRKDNLDFNNNKIKEAKSEGELWRIANDVIKPNKQSTIKLRVNGNLIEEEQEVAEAFNDYFIEKVHPYVS